MVIQYGNILKAMEEYQINISELLSVRSMKISDSAKKRQRRLMHKTNMFDRRRIVNSAIAQYRTT